MVQWVEKPVVHSVSAAYNKKESAVIVFDKRRYEYIDNAKKEVDEYFTFHRIIHVNDDRGIEMFNKIYLGINENSDIVDVRARTILSNGKIIELNQNNIKDLKENENVYKIFAMEGLEKGCDIEYLYTYKMGTSFFGREIVQGRFPVLVKSSFEIIAPERLQFEIKPYNFHPRLLILSSTTTGYFIPMSKKLLVLKMKNMRRMMQI